MNCLTATRRPRDLRHRYSPLNSSPSGSGSEVLEQPVSSRVFAEVQRTEAPRVAQPQGVPGREADVHVVVDAGRRVARNDTDVARHAEVQDGRAAGRVDQEILRAPLYRGDRLPGQALVHVLADRPAQAPLANRDVRDRLADDMGFDAAAAGFDFGQFGHAARVPTNPDIKKACRCSAPAGLIGIAQASAIRRFLPRHPRRIEAARRSPSSP